VAERKNNAHIRGQTPGAKQPVVADEAARLATDPTLQKAFEDVRMSLVRQIESAPISGDPRDLATEHEICQQLRGLSGVRRALLTAAQGQQLRAADFRPHAPEPKESA
jgi:hypothetical protein